MPAPNIPVVPFVGYSLGANNPKVKIEIFLDFCCPFSQKMFEVVHKIGTSEDFSKLGPVQFVFQNQIQPWHPQSAIVHEVAIAVGKVNRDKFWDFAAILFNKRSKILTDEACDTKCRVELHKELAHLSLDVGLDAKEVTNVLDAGVAPELKWALKYGRQRGIHVSPTIIANGVIEVSISSSWTTDQWLQYLKDALEHCS